jgi:hypothetical protein
MMFSYSINARWWTACILAVLASVSTPACSTLGLPNEDGKAVARNIDLQGSFAPKIAAIRIGDSTGTIDRTIRFCQYSGTVFVGGPSTSIVWDPKAEDAGSAMDKVSAGLYKLGFSRGADEESARPGGKLGMVTLSRVFSRKVAAAQVSVQFFQIHPRAEEELDPVIFD